jgi:formate hydrogenlyase transcriptional activator
MDITAAKEAEEKNRLSWDITEQEQMTQELKRSEAYLAEAQALSQTGSFGWRVSPEEHFWSEQTYRIFEFDRAAKPTLEAIFARVHPEDRGLMQQTVEGASASGQDFDFEYRLLMPDGRVKHLHVMAKAMAETSAGREFVGAVTDITAAKAADEKIRQSERELRELIDAIPQQVFVFDPDWNPLFANGRELEYTGLTPEEARSAAAVAGLFHPEDLKRLQEARDRSRCGGEPIEIEARIRGGDGQYRWFLVRDNPLRDEQGRILRWYGTRTDIEERKQAEEALRRSEAYLADAQRLTHTGVWAGDRTSKPLYWSEEVYQIFGFDPQQGLPTGEQALERIHPDDFDKFQRGTINEKGHLESEYRIVLPDGTLKYVSGSAHPVLDRDGEIVEVVGVIVDITERKRAEEALRESETRYRTFVDHAADAFFLHDQDHRILDVNRQACENLGYTHEELTGMHPFDLDPEVDAARLQQIRERLAAGEVCTFESRHRRKNGTVFPIEVRLRPFWRGDRLLHLALVRDITERKLAEEKLRQSEAYLAEAQRLTHTGAWATNAVPEPLYWSEELFRLYGLDPQQGFPTHEQAVQRVHPEDRDRYVQAFHRVIHQKVDSDVEFRTLLPDGTIRHLYGLGHPILNTNGDVVEVVGTTVDITERKLAEDKLRQNEAELRQMIEAIPQQVFVFDPDWNPVFANRRELEYLGLSLEQAQSKNAIARALSLEDLVRLQEARERARCDGTPVEIEVRIRGGDGQYRWFLIRDNPLRDEQGRILRWYGTRTDIEDRKQAEEALRESETRYRELIQSAQAIVWRGDARTFQFTFVSQQAETLLGYPVRRWLEEPTFWVDHIHPEDRDWAPEFCAKATREMRRHEFDYRMIAADGRVVWFHDAVGVMAENGQPKELIGVMVDITDKKEAEEAIRQSEADLRQILDVSPQHLAVLGPDRSDLYLNQAALDYHGLTLTAWQAGNRAGLFHPDDWERVDLAAERAFSTGSHLEIEARMPRHDGVYRWFLLRYKPVHDDQGRITRWVIAATDIDDRKREEERLQHENVALREEVDTASMFEEIVGSSPALRAVLSRVAKVAPADSTVLITGETGTGKELIARAIHKRSRRNSRAFISVNCAVIPRDLIASELFGHEKGAFTGATQRRSGRFELAEGGTIFLDEIAELPAETQVALLRVLQEREFERVGGERPIHCNVRVIAATNRDLKAGIEAGTFRNDLFYRLNVFPIEMPPLRERMEDIPLLVEYFIDRFARKAGKSFRRVSKRSLELLQAYPWPGNIRELQNIIERSVIVCDTENFSVDESWLSSQAAAASLGSMMGLTQMLAAQEQETIEAALRACGGRVSGPAGAAARLSMPRSTLESKIRTLKIDKNRFKTS